MTSYLSMLVVVVSVQVMVIDVAVCMVALRLLGGLGTTSVKHSIFSEYTKSKWLKGSAIQIWWVPGFY